MGVCELVHASVRALILSYSRARAPSSFSLALALLLTYKLIKAEKKDESFLLPHTIQNSNSSKQRNKQNKKTTLKKRGKFIVNSICDISRKVRKVRQ